MDDDIISQVSDEVVRRVKAGHGSIGEVVQSAHLQHYIEGLYRHKTKIEYQLLVELLQTDRSVRVSD